MVVGLINELLDKDEYISRKMLYDNNITIDDALLKKLEEHNRDYIKRKLIEYKEYFDNIDKLINNAGLIVEGGFLELSEEKLLNAIRIHLNFSIIFSSFGKISHHIEEARNLGQLPSKIELRTEMLSPIVCEALRI